MGADEQEKQTAGLCAHCLHVQRVRSARRVTFYYLCKRSVSDPSFVKYPRLPVIECRGYEPAHSCSENEQ
jgi:hypothetical protein